MTRAGILLPVLLCVSACFVGQRAGAETMEQRATFELPPDPLSFQQGPGSHIASTYCLICHSAEYIYMQPSPSRERWEAIVKKMKHAFGCAIPDEEIAPLVDYLVSQNDVQSMSSLPVQRETSQGPVVVDRAGTGDPEKGKRVFRMYCVNCHGLSGKGDGPIGQSLVPPAADLTLLGKRSDNAILDTIRNGRPGTAMPSWKNELSRSDMSDVLSFLRTFTR